MGNKLMVRRPARGFTLVELLVVITIIGILMALLLPAVNFAVENARQRSCMNNMKQFATACVSFDTTKQRYPGWANKQAYQDGMGKTAYRQVSWFVEITPQIERQDIYENWQANATPQTPYVDFAVCPSDPPDSNDGPYLAYVGNAGYQNATVGSENIANGIMHNQFPDTTKPNQRGPAITATQIKDGVTNTLLITENIQATRWDVANKYGTGFVWNETDNPTWRINGGDKNNTTATPDKTNARPSSNHPGGVNVAYADGHTGWLRSDIEYHVYVQLMTPRHNEIPTSITLPTTPVNWRNYILSDKDYK